MPLPVRDFTVTVKVLRVVELGVITGTEVHFPYLNDVNKTVACDWRLCS